MSLLASPVTNALTGEVYTLTPLAGLKAGRSVYETIAEVCNEERVYSLFAERLQGAPYTATMARNFVTWARQGWREETYFVYLILAPGGRVAGALDIKSKDKTSAEIGYWLSAAHRGVMTPAVEALCALAREAGYRHLFALILPENTRSRGVAQRAGFAEEASVERKGKSYLKYGCSLASRDD